MVRDKRAKAGGWCTWLKYADFESLVHCSILVTQFLEPFLHPQPPGGLLTTIIPPPMCPSLTDVTDVNIFA